MSTQKIQITLTPQEVATLSIKGKAMGYSVTKYVKFIIAREVDAIVREYSLYRKTK